jgi:sterol desaturase/sphingolipid hydroxylase (fatty acid hydroxylase superfamily)
VPALRLETLPLPVVFVATTLGFLAIYFGLGAGAWLLTTRVLPARGAGRPLADRPLVPGQIAGEIRASLISILIFGGFGVLTAVGARAGLWTVLPSRSAAGVTAELALLVVWNDVHFYVIHRLLHTRWLYQHVHREHHRAIRPTPFSTYAMHPVEATLLGSVMVCVAPLHAFSLPTLVVFPLVSLVFNNIGHTNYDLAPAASRWNPLAGSRRHEAHHRLVHGNYGFLLPLLDVTLRTELLPTEGAG